MASDAILHTQNFQNGINISEIGFISLNVDGSKRTGVSPMNCASVVIENINYSTRAFSHILPNLCKSRHKYLSQALPPSSDLFTCLTKNSCQLHNIDLATGLMLGKGDIFYIVDSLPSIYLLNRLRVFFYESNSMNLIHSRSNTNRRGQFVREILPVPCSRILGSTRVNQYNNKCYIALIFIVLLSEIDDTLGNNARYPLLSSTRIDDFIISVSEDGFIDNNSAIVYLTFQNTHRIVIVAGFDTLTEYDIFLSQLRSRLLNSGGRIPLLHSSASQIGLPVISSDSTDISNEVTGWQTSLRPNEPEYLDIGLLIKTKCSSMNVIRDLIYSSSESIDKDIASITRTHVRLGYYDIYSQWHVRNIPYFSSYIIKNIASDPRIVSTCILPHFNEGMH